MMDCHPSTALFPMMTDCELTTLHGLTASDGTRAYGAAMQDGCDAEGAWKCFLEETWRIDTLKATAAIDAALASDAGKGD